MRIYDSAVYAIRNLVTGKVYVGSSIKVKERFATHKRSLGRGHHGNEYLQRAWNKYGASGFVFEILERCAASVRLEREQYWINKLKADDESYGYNLIPTRKSQLYGSKIAIHQRKGWAKLTPEERRQKNGHLHVPEMRALSARLSGLTRSSPEHKERQRKIAETHLCTEENKQGNRNRQLKRWQDPTYRAKMLAALTVGRNKTNAKWKKPPKRQRPRLSSIASNEIV
jgi:group I intron endonuclease